MGRRASAHQLFREIALHSPPLHMALQVDHCATNLPAHRKRAFRPALFRPLLSSPIDLSHISPFYSPTEAELMNPSCIGVHPQPIGGRCFEVDLEVHGDIDSRFEEMLKSGFERTSIRVAKF